MSGLFKNGINYTGAIPTAEEVPFDKTKHNIGDNVQEAIDWTYIRAMSASSDLEDYELQTDRKFFEFGQRMGENEESVRELISDLSELEYLGYSIPDDMPTKDISKVDRVDMASMNWVYNEGSGVYRTTDLVNVIKHATSDATPMTSMYTASQPVIKSANDVYAGQNGIAVGSDGWVYFKNGSKPSGYLYYELSTAKSVVDGQQAITVLNENLDEQGLLNKFDGVVDDGYIYQEDGSVIYSDAFVHSVNKISVSSGDIITVNYEEVVNAIFVSYFNGNTFIKNEDMTNVKSAHFEVPNNANCVFVNLYKSSGLSKTTVKKISVYINNAIDRLDAKTETKLAMKGSEWTGTLESLGDNVCVCINGGNATDRPSGTSVYGYYTSKYLDGGAKYCEYLDFVNKKKYCKMWIGASGNTTDWIALN